MKIRGRELKMQLKSKIEVAEEAKTKEAEIATTGKYLTSLDNAVISDFQDPDITETRLYAEIKKQYGRWKNLWLLAQVKNTDELVILYVDQNKKVQRKIVRRNVNQTFKNLCRAQ